MDEQENVAPENASSSPSGLAPKKKRKWPIVTAVVAVVLVAAGAGFWVWHEQPSFCNAICHNPMDVYVESYESGDPSKLVTAHATEGFACLDCHEPKIDEQVNEAIAWVGGDFKTNAEGYIVGDFSYDEGFCLNESCHNMTMDALKQQTENDQWNPHDFHHGDLDCSTCHSMHGESSLYCAGCHEEAQAYADSIGWSYETQ